MLKDRIIEIGGMKRVLLPERCAGPSGTHSVKELCAILASDRHSLLVTGETGTGKEMLADCVMHMTKRPKGKCQRLNCAGLDSNLVGSELFGHKRGAFTGAEKDREGLLKACDGGVLFLDEIGWLLPDLQARLLRFMETGEIRPIGADRIEHHADVRIVAATNKDVEKAMIHDLRARFDFEVRLPPLRERAGDILWFLCEPGFLGAQEVFNGIMLRTLVGILTNEWPGNIRELKKYCQRKVILHPTMEHCCYDQYVLTDWNAGKPGAVEQVAGVAGLALQMLESFGANVKGVLEDPSVKRVLELLIGLFAGMKESLWECEHAFVPVIPVVRLKKALNGDLPEMGGFALELSIGNAFECVDRELDDAIGVNSLLSPFSEENTVDLVGFFDFVLRLTDAVISNKPSALTCTGLVNDRLEKVPVGPSNAFLEGIGKSGPDGLLFALPPPPAEAGGIERVLDELGIQDPDRSIALLCDKRLSNKEISEKVGLKPTTVGEHLMKLRRNKRLEGFLPKQAAGRRPSKQPD